MQTLSLGPLALPVVPLIVMASLWIASIVARRSAPPDEGAHAEGAIWTAGALGLLAARLVYVLIHHEAYLQHPWSVLDVRDGGFSPLAGFLVAFAWLARGSARGPGLRRSLLIATTVGMTLWASATTALWLSHRSAAEAGVPDVVLLGLADAKAQTLSRIIAGKPAVINLWASWCGPCRYEMPALADAQSRFGDVRFVFANQGESPDAVRDYLARERLTLREVWLDTGGALMRAFGTGGLPTTMFFDAQGRQIETHVGVLNAASLQVRVQALRGDAP